MNYDNEFQSEHNGPLTKGVRKRIEAAKNKLNLTLAQTGEELGFGGSFVSLMLRDEEPARVRTKHIDRMREAIEKMEVSAGIRTSLSKAVTSQISVKEVPEAQDTSLQDLISAAHKLGFSVTFNPIK